MPEAIVLIIILVTSYIVTMKFLRIARQQGKGSIKTPFWTIKVDNTKKDK